ncbi:MAG: transcription antitermination factor NusB [Vicinamibacteria bacterium]
MSLRAGKRRRAREIALQILFALEGSLDAGAEEMEGHFQNFKVAAPYRDFASRLIRGVLENRREIDALIEKACEHWKLSRLAAVDRNVMRIAVFELFHTSDVPMEVVLDEAIEIAKRFGSEESGIFVNGVLDRIQKERS